MVVMLSCVSYGQRDQFCELNYERLCSLTPYSAVFYKALKTKNKDYIEMLMGNAYYSHLYSSWGIDPWDIEFAFELFFDSDDFFVFIRDIPVMKSVFPELCKTNIEAIRKSFPITNKKPQAYFRRRWLLDYVLTQYEQWIELLPKKDIQEHAAFLQNLKTDQADDMVMFSYCPSSAPQEMHQKLPASMQIALQVEHIASLYDDPWRMIDQETDYCALRIQVLNEVDFAFD